MSLNVSRIKVQHWSFVLNFLPVNWAQICSGRLKKNLNPYIL